MPIVELVSCGYDIKCITRAKEGRRESKGMKRHNLYTPYQYELHISLQR